MKNIQDIQNIIFSLGERIGLSKNECLILDQPSMVGRPHVEISNDQYHYVVCERGAEFFRRSTTCLDEFLYWFFEALTSEISYEYELKNRVHGQDIRRIAFKKKYELLNLINQNWAKKWEQEKQLILKENPFMDVT